VKGAEVEGKTIYRITDDGASYLNANRERLDRATQLVKGRMGRDGDFPILRSAARLERTIRICLPELTQDRSVEVAKILDEASERVTRLVNEA
jgi:DNA-binding PadR family transcriptional regulator